MLKAMQRIYDYCLGWGGSGMSITTDKVGIIYNPPRRKRMSNKHDWEDTHHGLFGDFHRCKKCLILFPRYKDNWSKVQISECVVPDKAPPSLLLHAISTLKHKNTDELLAALLRHVTAAADPAEPCCDEESGLHHLCHAGACVLILLYKMGVDYKPSALKLKSMRGEDA